jgi:hypothetical protein
MPFAPLKINYFCAKKTVDIRRQSARFPGLYFMKCDTMNSVLTFVLGALVVLAVIFALQTIVRTREIRSLQIQMNNINANYVRLQALANDVNAYNQKNPSAELTHILQATH